MNELLQRTKHTDMLMTLPKEKERSDESEKCIFSYVDICTCLLNKMTSLPRPCCV
jgi:hypothetical protein